MKTLKYIEQLLLSIWTELYKKDKNNLPNIFSLVLNDIFPRYINYSDEQIQDLDLKERNYIIARLNELQSKLIELKLLDKKRSLDLSMFIQKISKRKSVKEQIEGYSDIGKLEIHFIKDLARKIESNTVRRTEGYVAADISKHGNFYLHTHPPISGNIFRNLHIPSIGDLISDLSVLEKHSNIKFGIIAVNNLNKVIGYFIYEPNYSKKLSKFKIYFNTMMEMPLTSFGYQRWYWGKLNKLGITYNYKTKAMPGYYWDDNDKIFKEKK